jgi:hypothetical protein
MIGKNLILPARFVAKASVPRPVSAETYTVHFKPVQSLILIETVINRVPARLIFDTGLTRTILSTEILGISPTIGENTETTIPLRHRSRSTY